MMHQEARWLRERLESFPAADLGPILSVGSGTRRFRTETQPWIEREVFAPLAVPGVAVLHHELDEGEGIDVAGDLTTLAVRQRLGELGVRTILCLNVLEHLREPAVLAEALSSALPSGGHLIVTVPRRFPYHPDPIDTMFRPDPDELIGLFPMLDVVDHGAIRCESLVTYWMAKPGKVAALMKFAHRSGGDGANPERPLGTTDRPSTTSLIDLARMALLSTELTFGILRRP